MDDIFSKLEAEYCPPLDPALLSAILSDFDLSLESDIKTAKATLDPLKENALLEEQAGFDASGTGARDEGLVDPSRPESCPDTSAGLSRDTDLASLSTGLSSLELEAHDEGAVTPGSAEKLEQLDEDTKVQLLLDVFQDRVSVYKAQYALRKCNGRWHAAMEELLNHVFFDEAELSDSGSKVAAKGIDAFSEDNVMRRGRKGKSKKKILKSLDERRSNSLPVSPAEPSLPSTNKWQTSSQDIEFVANRTGITSKSVASIYYNAGTSLSRTIGVILKDRILNDEPSDDPILAVNAHDLETEFPAISSQYAHAIVRITHPSTAAAHELAKALTARPHGLEGGIQLIPNYARPKPEDLDSSWQTVTTKMPSATRADNFEYQSTSAIDRAAGYTAARNTALAQAHAAHRRAKSDRNMGGAAAYYGQVGREYGVLSLRASAEAADELADVQSTRSQLDLHGIDVLNAVRIAQEKVEQWWQGLGEHRANGRLGAEERQAGYRIVVGLGRHSEGGRSKLGPAVSKMLRNDGWKIEATGAVIMVKGRGRK